MNRRLLLQSTTLLPLISLSARASAKYPHGTLYKDKNCPCCEGHAKYLKENGIDAEIKAVDDIAAVNQGAGIPAEL